MRYLALILHHPDEYGGADQIGVFDTEEQAQTVVNEFNETNDNWAQSAFVVPLPNVLNTMVVL